MNRRLEFHHIKQWHVYKTHDETEMVAVCPVCHDAIHHGEIKIDDETVHRWKAIKGYPTTSHVLTIEPGKHPLLFIGGGPV